MCGCPTRGRTTTSGRSCRPAYRLELNFVLPSSAAVNELVGEERVAAVDQRRARASSGPRARRRSSWRAGRTASAARAASCRCWPTRPGNRDGHPVSAAQTTTWPCPPQLYVEVDDWPNTTVPKRARAVSTSRHSLSSHGRQCARRWPGTNTDFRGAEPSAAYRGHTKRQRPIPARRERSHRSDSTALAAWAPASTACHRGIHRLAGSITTDRLITHERTRGDESLRSLS